ncbi:DUF3987 domain-containing protein [Limnoglobus roseus]|uniref:DUF3987 domain-containing protein n=1 Tax=Limnoglobus roseus TaxID=2598579 RepID=A0A5C1AHD8_9BACT|nr:DUF3987 domain-containing protein [Limnoglobus roseus]QEL18839.1 hypothetical protein PX52LOC_05880 [Limnoglobus roseus]
MAAEISFRASPANPCPVCGGGSKGCSAVADGLHFCRGTPRDGWRRVGQPDDNGFTHYRRADDRGHDRDRPATVPLSSAATPQQLRNLADALKLPAAALAALPIGWDGEAWTVPEVDAKGATVGIHRRFPNGKKYMQKGGHRGLVLPRGWREKSGPVLVVEGMSDALAGTYAGLACVGRPNNAGGGNLLAELLRGLPIDRAIVVVGENDQKADGLWPGKAGAEALAGRLANDLARPIVVAIPPGPFKDVRDWLTAKIAKGVRWPDAGQELCRLLTDGGTVTEAPANPTAVTKPGVQAPAVTVPEYRPFPTHCLPDRVQNFAETVARATNTDPSYAALPILSVLGAAVGTTRVVCPKAGWRIFPAVWAITIGRSASGKSPPQIIVNNAVQLLEDDLEAENDAARGDHERRLEGFRRQRRESEDAVRPAEPREARFRVGDVTVESLAGILADNPRGCWLWCDEAAGWLTSFTRYKSGGGGDSDRPRWLSLFDSGALTADRKTGTRRTVRVRNSLVCVCGGIQPSILKSLMTPDNVGSGLFARILLAYPPERLQRWTEVGVADDMVEAFAGLLRELRGFGFDTLRGRPVPAVNHLSADAKALFVAYYDRNREAAHTGTDGEAASLLKLESYAVRFAHLRHLCRHTAGGDGQPIDALDMHAGIELAEWFADELFRIQAALQETEHERAGRCLVDLVHRRGGAMTARDLQKHNARKYRTAAHAEAALQSLVDGGLGEWLKETAANGQTVRRFRAAPSADGRQTPSDAPAENVDSPGKSAKVSERLSV